MNTLTNQVNYQELLSQNNGFVFKVAKKEDTFIHTFIEGGFLHKLGLSPDDVIGKELFEFLSADIAEQKLAIYKKVWDGENDSYEGEINGHYYVASLSPIFVGSEIVGIIGTAIDITEKKNREMIVQMHEKLSLVGQLTAGVAHEIRNPLTSIIGFTQMIQENIENEETERYLTIILSELERINIIIDEFMFIAEPKEHINFTENNINALVNTAIHLLEPELIKKNITIMSAHKGQITAICDAEQIKQALIQLMQNAIESLEKDHIVNVALLTANDNQFLIKVTDKGCGLSEERLKRLFEPFYSTKEKGTGLGLMVTKRIIENHHGRIDIHSIKGQGTTVEVYLPLSAHQV